MKIWKFRKKGKKEAGMNIDEAIKQLRISERRTNTASEQFRSKIQEANIQAERSYNAGRTHQFKRFVRLRGEANKRLEFHEILSAEIGSTLDTLLLCKTSETIEDVARVLSVIHTEIGLDTKELEKAAETMYQLKENAREMFNNLRAVEGSSALMSEEEYRELESEMKEEFEAKREIQASEIESEKEKLARLQAVQH